MKGSLHEPGPKVSELPQSDFSDRLDALLRLKQEAHSALGHETETYLLRAMIDQIPDFLFVKDAENRFVVANRSIERAYGREPGGLVDKTDHDLHPVERADEFLKFEQEIMRSGQPLLNMEETFPDSDGVQRWFSTTKVPLRDAFGQTIGLIGVARDITERKQMEAFGRQQSAILEMIAKRAPLEAVLGQVVLLAESQLGGSKGSILLLDAESGRLRHAAAPSLPDAYNRAIDGVMIGPAVGSCGTAAFRRERVYAADIESDPLWDDYRHLAKRFGFRSCWSAPICSHDGPVLGTFAIYASHARNPTEGEVSLIEAATRIAGIAIERHQSEVRLIRMTESLARSKNLFDRAAALTRMGAWEWKLDTDELIWTDGMYDIHEVPRGSPMTPSQVLEFYPDGIRQKVQRLNAKTTEFRSYVHEAQLITGRKNKRWVRLTGSAERENGVIVRRFGVKQDVTAQKAVWDRMQFLAECDPLTGLANRSAFQKRLRRPSLRGKPDQSASVTLLLIDVDGFKHINDTFGHSVGDACLRQIAKRLRGLCDASDIAARLGGDEFALLVDSLKDSDAIAGFARRLLTELRRPIRWNSHAFQLSGSIGIAVGNQPQPRSARLFIEADLALYAAKEAGRDTFRMFTPDLKERADERFAIIGNINRALDENELELFYQPKVRLSDEGLAGFEALLRWRRSDGEVIVAGAFASAFDEPKLSGRIGEFVVRTALSQAQAWDRAGLDFGHIAINLSSSQLLDASFADRFIAQMSERGLRPDAIEIEVTEGVLLSPDHSNARVMLQRFRDFGIRIALDDFGMGYASLSHLRTYEVDCIKIDRTFVHDFLNADKDHVIIQSILFMARHLRLDVVAEGIETRDQFECLKAFGCRYGQGYWFTKAVCAREAAEWCLSREIKASPKIAF